jgi:predicted GIY-YIG superfamily endonuclease
VPQPFDDLSGQATAARFAARAPLVRGISMAWMYILECSDGSYYVGSTRDLEGRLFQHRQGMGAKYTSRRLPIKLVYSEEFERVADAYAREKQVQNWSRAKREALICGRQEMLPQLARKVFEKRKKPLVE